MSIHWKAVEQCFTLLMLVFRVYSVGKFILDLSLSGVKGLSVVFDRGVVPKNWNIFF